jgi:Binding-protein-dependent transport system inner membrane component
VAGSGASTASWAGSGSAPSTGRGDRLASWVAISTMVGWRWTGYNALIYLAAMQSVPKDLYEAAALDGAGSWHQLWRVTVPMIRPTLIFTIVPATIGQMQLFTEPLLFNEKVSDASGGSTASSTRRRRPAGRGPAADGQVVEQPPAGAPAARAVGVDDSHVGVGVFRHCCHGIRPSRKRAAGWSPGCASRREPDHGRSPLSSTPGRCCCPRPGKVPRGSSSPSSSGPGMHRAAPTRDPVHIRAGSPALGWFGSAPISLYAAAGVDASTLAVSAQR